MRSIRLLLPLLLIAGLWGATPSRAYEDSGNDCGSLSSDGVWIPCGTTIFEANVRQFGAKGDMTTGTDGVIAASATLLTSATITCSPADIGKRFEMNGVAATITGAPLITTVSSCDATTGGFNLADAATIASGRSFLNVAQGSSFDNTTITGNYAINDVLTFAGGTTTGGGTATTVTVQALQAAGTLAVVAGGSGGTDGTFTFVGTTGTGKKLRFRGTVVSGALNAVSTILDAGKYTAAPTNAGDTIASKDGDNPLAGATVSYQLGVAQVSISNRGNYLTPPASPVATGTASISSATGVTMSPTWVTTSTFVLGTDDTTAFSNAITAAIAAENVTQRYGRRTIHVPAGHYLINGSVLPVITRPVRIEGDGMGQTQIYAGASYAGAYVFAFSDLYGSNAAQPSNAFIYQMAQMDYGAGVHKMTIFGNLSAASIPDAIVLYGRNDHLFFSNLSCQNTGSCIASGRVLAGQTIGYWAESLVFNLHTRGAGRSGYGVIDIDSVGTGGASNEIAFINTNIVFPVGNGVRLVNHTTGTKSNHNNRFSDLRIEAQSGDPNESGSCLLQIGSTDNLSADVAFYDFSRVWLVGPPNANSAICLNGITEASIPHDIAFQGIDITAAAATGGGINIQAGQNLYFNDIRRDFTVGTFLTVAPTSGRARYGKTLQAGSSTTNIILDAAASATTDLYTGNALTITTSASVTATFATSVMTVTAVGSGTLAVGQTITATGVTYGTTIASLGTGTGGTGTYNLSTTPGTLGSRTVTASLTQGRLITAYNGGTKAATVGALQGSAAGFSTAPAVSTSYSIERLIQPVIYVDANGSESEFVTSIGAGAAPYLSSSPFLTGSFASGAQRTLTTPLALTGLLYQFGSTTTVPAHVATAQTSAPALTSCGTGSPAITGTDTAGIVTMGTNATGCVITFNVAYTATPYCVVSWIATPLASQSYVTSTAAITITQTSTSGNKAQYICMAQAGG